MICLSRLWITSVVAAAVAMACTSATTSTPSPTASVRQPTSSAQQTSTVPPPASPTQVVTPVAAAPGAQLPTFRLIDSVQTCYDSVGPVSTLDLPRQIVSVTPASVRDGDSVTISAVGYLPNTGLEVRTFIPGTNRISQPLERTVSNEAGQASATFAIQNVRALNDPGDTDIPVCLGIVLWSPAEVRGAISFVVPER